MKNTITLSIPGSCNESWESFTSTSQGGFCQSCQKEVVDFTLMRDDEILNFFKSKPQHICGKFKTSQLRTYALPSYPLIKPGLITLKAGVFSLFMLAFSFSSYAQIQSKAPTEVVPTAKKEDMRQNEFIINGVVTSSDDGSPLPAVNIFLKNDISIGTVSDTDGKFEFPRKLKPGEVLMFSFIGMETKQYTISEQASNDLDIKLNVDLAMDCVVMMGEVAVDAAYAEPSMIQKLWNKVKAVF